MMSKPRYGFLLTLLLLAGGPPAFAVDIDGRVGDSEWQGAEHITDFRKTQPLTGEPPSHATEAWILSTPEGLAVALRNTQPASVPRTQQRVQRDFEEQVDRVNVIVDFDADGRTGYDFRVSSTDDVYDSVVTDELQFNKDWDGNWKHAVGVDEAGWTVEVLIPWYIASMRDAKGDKRTIKIYLDRIIGTTGERVAYFDEVIDEFGLVDRAALLSNEGAVRGPELATLLDVAAESALINISGHVDHARLFERFRTRVYIDIDPGFTQSWHAAGLAGARLDGHDHYVTIAERIGATDCPIPTCGLEWKTVRQPVVLGDWPVVAPVAPLRFTTVGSWRGPFGPVTIDDRTFGLKVHEFRSIITLPTLATHLFELALDIHPGDDVDRQTLLANSWRLVDPRAAHDQAVGVAQALGQRLVARFAGMVERDAGRLEQALDSVGVNGIGDDDMGHGRTLS